MDKVRRREDKQDRMKLLIKNNGGKPLTKTRQPKKAAKVRPVHTTPLPKKTEPVVDLPSQVLVKLVSVKGEELCPEMTVNIDTTRMDLNVLINKLKAEEEISSYI